MSDEQIREIKRKLCSNCGDRCHCYGMESCKDVNEYISKKYKRSVIT